jgi:SRSO17 transposase
MAKSLYLSNLPLPVTDIINLDVKKCDSDCLRKYLQNEEIFSFISNYKNGITDTNLSKEYETLKIKLNIFNTKKIDIVKVALMVPKNIIGRYSISTTNTVLAYLLQKGVDFDFELFDSKDETLQNIQNTVKKIENEGFDFVIAPYTDTGVKRLLGIDSNLIYYIPTINKNEIPTQKTNFIFGGIDYKKQIERLLVFTNEKIAIFADESNMGFKLSSYIQSDGDRKIVYKKVIPQKLTKFKSFLKHNKKLQNSSIFLNTPLVKTSLLASQFRFYKIVPYALFSTQINYNPLLLSLTQYDDRKNMYIANSIGESDNNLVTANKILDNNILYDWINYSTSIGIDYIYTLYFDSDARRSFSENILSNQVNYGIQILKPTKSAFKEVVSY